MNIGCRIFISHSEIISCNKGVANKGKHKEKGDVHCAKAYLRQQIVSFFCSATKLAGSAFYRLKVYGAQHVHYRPWGLGLAGGESKEDAIEPSYIVLIGSVS